MRQAKGGSRGLLIFGKDVLGEPLLCCFGVGADEEDFLDGAGGVVLAFEAGGGGVLDFEGGGGFAAADFDSAGDDAGDVGAVLDDVVEELVEAEDAAVLAFDAAEFHGNDYSRDGAASRTLHEEKTWQRQV